MALGRELDQLAAGRGLDLERSRSRSHAVVAVVARGKRNMRVE